MNVQEFLEIEEIKRLKYAYMRCVDRKLWDEMATLFFDRMVTIKPASISSPACRPIEAVRFGPPAPILASRVRTNTSA